MVKLREELADMWRLELGESEGRQERSLKESLAAFETRNDSRLEELLGPIDSRLRKLEDAVFRIG
jgi:hypothetical protein